ncbi:hypothetical protein AK830_g10681 [Neonectria ditissima]|uniref:Uncharacterized protein n=1 Tax=Neonectria ditissima TaxID=78410 RepID=A0A0P7B9Z8_9HYPO|nr:hypothetical protein AK830_g10681 [Neonectria ditissima]
MSSSDQGRRRRRQDDTDDEEPFADVSKQRKTTHEPDNNRSEYRRNCNQPRLSQHDYTAGWICALPIEMAAASAMLDRVHKNLPTNPTDINTYTLGNIGMHNVVIACLPSGGYGLNNAATVASNMRRSFPSMRFGLMVGVGGGVPSKVDIRLGDVVVSKEVVQYDMGKTVHDGRFQRTGTLNKPPQALLTAVAKLQADHASRPSKIPALLSKMLERYPSMAKYTHPGPLQDQLFEGTYDHIQPVNNCDGCDVSKLVSRPARTSTDPKIHYGVIASGNQVMEHGKTRDRLAQELDAICFEMEAAGLMDNFPCLVIRGICDYSDSHKNKHWQEYAAATAAAYAVELLEVVSATSINHTHSPVEPSDADRVILQQRRATLLDLLKFDQIYARRMGVKAAHDKTCEWLLEDPEYQHWLDPIKLVQHHGFLWINGKPGAGKSTIMKFAHSHAIKSMKNTTVISFFFNARGEDLEKSTAGMYRSLLWQLLGKIPTLQEVLDDSDLIPLSQSDCPTWETEVLRSLFSRSIAKLGPQRLVCFVDALDECDREELYDMVEDFQALGEDAASRRSSLQVCFSSRHYPSIDIGNGRQLTLQNRPGHEHDIEAYIRDKLKLGKGRNFEADELRNELRDRANGVFLWVRLVVQMLNKEFGRASTLAIRKKRLREIPTELSELFKDMLKRDNERPEDLLLSMEWILYAKRPLKWEELYFALISGLHPNTLGSWNPEETTVDDMKRFILGSSKGLAEITKPKARTVQFIHESVRDFLLKDHGLRDLRHGMGLPGEDFASLGHDQLKQCCDTYIKLDISDYAPSSEPLPKASSNAAKDLRASLARNFPFLEYATCHIFHHADSAANGLSQDNFLEDFDLQAWIHLDNLFEKYEIRRHTPTASLLYIFAESNLTNLIGSALRLDSRLSIPGERYRYPLFAALANGHRGAVQAMFQREARLIRMGDVSAQMEYGKDFSVPRDMTPLQWATMRGHEGVVKLLLATDGTDTMGDSTGWSPLLWAAEFGHEGVVKLLLATDGIDTNMGDSTGRSPLSWAAGAGHEGVVKLLLATDGIDTNMGDSTGWSPLLWAIIGGHEGVVKLLLATDGIDTNMGDSTGRSPLLWAARGGHEGVVKLLLATDGIDTNMGDSTGWSPLLWAARGGHEGVVKLLLATEGVKADLEDMLGRTPLSWAAERGHEEIVKLLLATGGVDTNSKDGNGKTPLKWAVEMGHWSIVKILEAYTQPIKEYRGRTTGKTILNFE